MKRSQLYFALAAFASLTSAGCGGFTTTETNVYQIPWPDEAGAYHLQHVTIDSFDQPSSLQGRYVHVMVNPGYVDGQLQEEKATGHFTRTRDGVMVPTDYTSIEAAALHAHFERFAKMNAELGVSMHWPARIAIDVNVRLGGKRSLNNAFYTRELDALFVPPYTALDVPIAVNAGALAHEYFHMIFQDAVFKHLGSGGQFPTKLSYVVQAAAWREDLNEESPAPAEPAKPHADQPQTPRPTDQQIMNYNAFYLSALNEGLADFWAWVYTGDPEFIKPSFPKFNEVRRLDSALEGPIASKPQLLGWTLGRVRGNALSVEQLKASSYSVGTTYARLLYRLAHASSKSKKATREERMKTAAAVVKSLPAFAEKIAAVVRSKEMISPSTFWATLYPNFPSTEAVGGGRLCRTLQRFVAPDGENELASLQCLEAKSSSPRASPAPVTQRAPPAPITPSARPGPQSPTTTPFSHPAPTTPSSANGDEP